MISAPSSLPPNTAPSDKPMFARMFSASRLKRLLSKTLLVSNAKEDMVVKEPQNPTATSKVYCGFKFNPTNMIEKKPKMKLPIMLTANTLTGNPYRHWRLDHFVT
jgi:hypothetical protein